MPRYTIPLLLLLCLSCFLCLPASAAEPRLGESCGLVIPERDQQRFLAFDRELRQALERQDAAALSLLTQFPLRLNFEGDTALLIPDPATLAARFVEIFPPALRQAVSRQKTEELICVFGGMGYGNGAVWIEAAENGGFKVAAVTSLAPAPSPAHAQARIEMACEAEGRRVLVEHLADGTPRYRQWTRPRLLNEAPDVEISTGTDSHEGRGPCFYRIWSFEQAGSRWEVSEMGCSPTPFTGAFAKLEVSKPGSEPQTFGCF